MKIEKKLVVFLLLVCFAVTLAPLAAAEDYTYTVRIFAGTRGSFVDGSEAEADGSVKIIRNVPLGTRLDASVFNTSMIQVNDDRYHVTGLHISGRDVDDPSTFSSPVTRDLDFVVTYGVPGEEVRAVITYKDKNGKELAQPSYFYGNAGETFDVNFLYVDGYRPQAYTLRKTLRSDESQNVFPFVYTAIPAATPTPAPTTAPATQNTTAGQTANSTQTANSSQSANSAQSANSSQSANSAQSANSSQTANSAQSAGSGSGNGDETRSGVNDGSAAPEEILDLDASPAGPDGSDPGTYSNGGKDQSDGSGAFKLSRAAVIGIVTIGLAIIILLLWILLYLRGRRKNT